MTLSSCGNFADSQLVLGTISRYRLKLSSTINSHCTRCINLQQVWSKHWFRVNLSSELVFVWTSSFEKVHVNYVVTCDLCNCMYLLIHFLQNSKYHEIHYLHIFWPQKLQLPICFYKYQVCFSCLHISIIYIQGVQKKSTINNNNKHCQRHNDPRVEFISQNLD